MERAELRLAPGLNVVTGETGAGKTLLAHALDLLLGGRARHGIVRQGAPEAYVEGVFSVPAGLGDDLRERLPDDAHELVLARRVWPDGRTRAYVCGRSATVADLRDLGSRLLAFYGQHEHRRLMLGSAQLEILDSFGGEEHRALRGVIARDYEEVRRLRARAQELEGLTGARERELDLVSFELGEIDAVAPSEAEEAELSQERERLRHQQTLRLAAAAGAEALSPQEGPGVVELLAGVGQQLEAAAAIDPALAPVCERVQGIRYEAEDLGRELRGYIEGVEGGPGRLEEVEERLALFTRLQRKHGGSIAEVLGHAERCRARREELEHADVALDGVQQQLAAGQAQLDQNAAELSERRQAGALALAAGVRERLGELALPDARFEVQLWPRPEGCGPTGTDSIEFSIAPNPGLPGGPLREIASGGELSRVMLALLSVAHGRGAATASSLRNGHPPRDRAEQPLLVFDEIDAGVGGHTARAVGEQLRELAHGRQILCITHLPQVAALGARHFTIVKDNSASPASTTVNQLEGDAVVDELVRMLGAGGDDRGASQHARQLLRAA